jgi:acyl carrier protein
MSIESEIKAQFKYVAEEHDRQLSFLTDDLELLESGLDSLSFAVLVVRLEEKLGVDPFSTTEDVVFPLTFGEFVRFYENACRESETRS